MGGAEMQAQKLVQRITELDAFDVHYVARRVRPDFPAEGYTLHQIPPRPHVLGKFFFDMPALSRLLKRLQPDVVYQRVACAYTGVAAHYAGHSGKRMVWHVSSDRDLIPVPWHAAWRSPVEQLNRRLIEHGAQFASVVVVQNRAQAALLKEHYRRNDAVLIPNFHSLPSEPVAKGDTQYTVCWIGNIKAIKRPELFVRLAADFSSRRDVDFVMVGAVRAEKWSDLLGDIEKLPNLQYLGAQSQSAVNALLARAHVLVNTSVYEGFPNTFIQAWLRRTAVLSMSANPDATLDGDQYGICSNGSYESLKKGLERLLSEAELRDEMGQRASEYAERIFSCANIDRLLNVLDGRLD